MQFQRRNFKSPDENFIQFWIILESPKQESSEQSKIVSENPKEFERIKKSSKESKAGQKNSRAFKRFYGIDGGDNTTQLSHRFFKVTIVHDNQRWFPSQLKSNALKIGLGGCSHHQPVGRFEKV